MNGFASSKITTVLAAMLVLFSLTAPVAGSSVAAPRSPQFREGGGFVVLRWDPTYFPHRVSAPRVVPRIGAKSATITVNYLPGGSTNKYGTSCYDWPNDAKNAFNYAASVWAGLINSSVPIEINACWASLSSGILGYGGAVTYHHSDEFTGEPQPNRWYQAALANSIAGSDLNDSDGYDDDGDGYDDDDDMILAYSQNYDWYFGTDGMPGPTEVDFVSVVLHEIAHGLGFSGSMSWDDGVYDPGNGNYQECNGTSGVGCWGIYGTATPAIYDQFTENGSNQALLSFSNNSTALGNELIGQDLFFDGPNARAGNGGPAPELYAPSTWKPGSSYSHLDESYNGTPNALMTYSLSNGEANHSPGPVALGILEDLGWTLESVLPAPTVDSIAPSTGVNTGTVHVTITGSHFLTPTVRLSRSGHTDIPGTGVSTVGTTTITCDFNLIGAAVGPWNVVVVNEDEQFGQLTNGFTVEAPPAPDVSINKEVIGSDFQPGDSITFTLTIANGGDKLASHVVVTDDLPAEVLTPTVASTLDITSTGAFSYVWDVEPLEIGESGVITIHGQLSATMGSSFSFKNTAAISDPEDTTPGNNTSSVTVGETETFLPLVVRGWPPEQTEAFYPSADATIIQGAPSTNFGSTTDMWVGYDHVGCTSGSSWAGQISRSLIQFDLSSIPAGALVTEATLYLRQVNYCDIGQRTHTVTAHRTGGSWTYSTVTWNNRPSLAEAHDSTSVTSGDWGWYSFDVTDLVQGWVDGNFSNYGITLRGPESSGDSSARIGFATMNTTGTTYDPYLEVTYLGTGALKIASPGGGESTPVADGMTVRDQLGVFGGPFGLDDELGLFESAVCPFGD